MHFIRDVLDTIRKLDRIRNDPLRHLISRRPFDAPAIINVDILVAQLLESEADHQIGHADEDVVADVAAKFVPGIPAHRG